MQRLPFFSAAQSGASHKLGAALGHAFVFLLGLIGFCRLMDLGLGADPRVALEPEWRSQLLMENFLKQKDELDLVFVGSSRLVRGVDPSVFDEMTAKAGAPTRSFNYGMNGMRMPEIMARVDWIIAQAPKRLRFVLVELTTLDPLYRAENRSARRMIEWHTDRVAWESLGIIAGSDRSWADKWRDARAHLVEYGLQLGNLGLARKALATWGRAPAHTGRESRFDGYLSAEEEAEHLATLGLGDVQEVPAKRTPRKALVQRESDLRDDLAPAQERVLRGFIERVEAAGLQLVFVNTPAPRLPNTPGYRADRTGDLARARELLPESLNYHSREHYGALYEFANFRDSSHLNNLGASVFSRRLALDFVTHCGARLGSE